MTVSASMLGGMALGGFSSGCATTCGGKCNAGAAGPFQLSLAEWSLNRALHGGAITNMDFPRISKREFGIDCIELVDQFMEQHARDETYLREFKQRADDEGVRIGLIMIDTNGHLGATDPAERAKAVENTYQWIDAARFFGCYAVRINAHGEGSPDDILKNVAESCVKLCDYAEKLGIAVIVENHGGHSSDPHWLEQLVKTIGHANFGTLPDFGNFAEGVDRYDATERILPFAKAVSAKSTQFSPEGNILETDYNRMLRIVRDSGYKGYVGVESCPPNAADEYAAVRWTRDTLLSIFEAQARCADIFNGKDLTGWVAVEGGEWTIENGILIGRHGKNWTTNPEKTGSWLHTEKQYADFRLELQYAINSGGNSGVFFRSADEKNPAFTGYEMQIVDGFGAPPHKHAATALYDLVAPVKNGVRPAGEWNTVTITAQGPKICIEMNGEVVLTTEQMRGAKGFIGLQNHDDKSEVRFRNIRIEEL